VLRIRHLLLNDGLTLAGVRRKLEEEAEPPLDVEPVGAVPPPLAPEARARIGDVKRGLRSLLELLDAPLQGASASGPTEQPSAASNVGAKTASPRRKRSA
jgi:hypothetical protein